MKNFLLFLLILLTLTGCGEKEKSEESSQSTEQEIKVTKDESKISLKTLGGTTLTLHKKEKGFVFETLEHKAVLLTFLTTWCPPCKGQIPHLINLKNRYAQDFEIIAIVLEENKSMGDISAFAQENDINFIVTNSQENFELSNYIGDVKSIPYMVLYDREGDYFKHYIGAIPEEMLEVDIKKIL